MDSSQHISFANPSFENRPSILSDQLLLKSDVLFNLEALNSKIKLEYNRELRKVLKLRKYGPSTLNFTYTDQDEDIITISTDSDLQEFNDQIAQGQNLKIVISISEELKVNNHELRDDNNGFNSKENDELSKLLDSNLSNSGGGGGMIPSQNTVTTSQMIFKDNKENGFVNNPDAVLRNKRQDQLINIGESVILSANHSGQKNSSSSSKVQQKNQELNTIEVWDDDIIQAKLSSIIQDELQKFGTEILQQAIDKKINQLLEENKQREEDFFEVQRQAQEPVDDKVIFKEEDLFVGSSHERADNQDDFQIYKISSQSPAWCSISKQNSAFEGNIEPIFEGNSEKSRKSAKDITNPNLGKGLPQMNSGIEFDELGHAQEPSIVQNAIFTYFWKIKNKSSFAWNQNQIILVQDTQHNPLKLQISNFQNPKIGVNKIKNLTLNAEPPINSALGKQEFRFYIQLKDDPSKGQSKNFLTLSFSVISNFQQPILINNDVNQNATNEEREKIIQFGEMGFDSKNILKLIRDHKNDYESILNALQDEQQNDQRKQ